MAETGELLGTARVSLVMDADQWDAEVQRAKNRAAELGTTGESAFNKLSAAEKRATESALRMAQGFGKSREEMRLVELQAKGALPASIEKARQALERTRRETDQGAISLSKYGISAKQTAAAMRGLPAQVTDIFTGLASGQNPMTVLIQQGGQLKDMFGGIAPAARALGGSLMALVNPATLAAGAVVGLAAAWEAGARESRALENALIVTGNQAGVTAADLGSLAARLDEISGVTTRKAAAALNEVARTGKFTGEQLGLVGRAALQMEQATGKAISETVAEFVELSRDPVAAVLKLNDTYHFLTETTFRQILALKEQGQEVKSATLAIREMSETIDGRTGKMVENIGYLEKAWRRAKEEAGEFLDTVLEIGRAPTGESVSRKIKQWQHYLDLNPNMSAPERSGIEERIRAGQRQLVQFAFDANQASLQVGGSMSSKKGQEIKAAADEWNRWVDQNLSKHEKQLAEEKRIQEAGKLLGKEQKEIDAQLVESRKRFMESASKDRRTPAAKTDPTEAIIQRLRQQIALNEEQVKSEDRLTATERLLVNVRTDLEKIGAKGSKTNKALIETLIDQAKASGEAAEKAMLEVKAKEALARQNAILEQQGATRARSNELDLMQFGRGSDVVAQLRRQLEVQREYQDELKRLGDRSVADDKETWDRLAENAAKHRDEQLRLEREYQDRRLLLMGDWRSGYQKAFEDYLASAQDISGQSYDFFNNTFEGLTDSVVGFAKGSKDAFDDLLDYWYEAALRFMSDQAIAAFLKAIGGSGGGNQSAANNYGELAGTIIDFFSSANSGFGFAKGGAFDRGAERFANGGAFTNTIVSKPTNFRFAKGIGLMGEEGPEAIMPLRRLPDGRLGVESVRNGGAHGTQTNNYTVNVPIYGKATADTRAQAANSISREIRNASRFRQ